MKKDEVKVGGMYVAKVSDKIVTVRIDSAHSKGGWNATNTATGKRIRIKSAQRLRGPAKNAAKAKERNDRDKDRAPRSELTLEEAAKLEKVRAAKAKTKATNGEQKPKRVSALDAAAQVLGKTEKPMGARELIAAMAEQGLWTSPAGKTPHATLYAAILREIAARGDAARFKKVDRGLFAFNKAGA